MYKTLLLKKKSIKVDGTKKLKKIEKQYYETDFSKQSNSNLKLLVVLAFLGFSTRFTAARDVKEFVLVKCISQSHSVTVQNFHPFTNAEFPISFGHHLLPESRGGTATCSVLFPGQTSAEF